MFNQAHFFFAQRCIGSMATHPRVLKETAIQIIHLVIKIRSSHQERNYPKSVLKSVSTFIIDHVGLLCGCGRVGLQSREVI